jgi:thioesterase domain-containing protein
MDGNDLLATIERKALMANVSPRSKIALVPLNQRVDDNQPVFYCVHDLSCSANSYLPLAREVAASSLHVVGVQAPQSLMKRCERSATTFPASLGELASYYVSELINYQPSGSIIIGGWSVGAVIALEMAEQLAAKGRKIRLLVVIDGAPENTLTGMKRNTPQYYVKLISNLVRCIMHRDIRALATSLYYKALILRKTVQLQHPAAKTFASYEQYMPHMQAFVRRLYEIVDAYAPAGKYLGPVIVFEADEQPLFHLRQVGEIWRVLAPAAEIIRIRRSDHRGLINPPRVGELAEQLLRKLGLFRYSA